MKQARRKELKTNELSVYLQQIQESVVRHSNYIIGGIVVVVLILMIGLYVQSSRQQAETARTTELLEIRKDAAGGVKPELVERAKILADQTADDPNLAASTREEHAELAYQLALDTSPVSNPDEYVKRLEEAKSSYEIMTRAFPDLPQVEAKGHLGLGSTLESLHVVGKASLEDVRKEYQAAANSGTFVAGTAKDRLDSLAERTRPLKIVATLPAEPVESAPAASPAATAPAAGPTPANAPAAAPVASKAPATAPASAPQP